MARSDLDKRLHEIHALLQEVVQERQGDLPDDANWFAPSVPPIDAASRLSATDLLCWWFRPPTKSANVWDLYLGGATSQTEQPDSTVTARASASSPPAQSVDPVRRAIFRTLLTEEEEGLFASDADAAVDVFYGFLHAFGRGDVEGALQYVADDYHTFEQDREVNRQELANRLESLLASLHGWELAVSLSMVPEPLRHPYGIVIYAEIQLDAVHPETREKRNLVERRLVLLERQTDKSWKIAAFSAPRI